MPGFAGFDSADFPGADVMAWLKANTNLVWCGYYLAPAPSHRSTSWMGQRAALQSAGWGVAPVYVGQQLKGPGSHVVTGAQGAIDGADAANLLAGEGFPAGSCVYLDLEDGPPFNPPRTDYVAAWVDAVAAAGFLPGVYCSHGFAANVRALRPAIRIWAYKVPITAQHPVPGTSFPESDPSGCGYPGAHIWQLDQNGVITVAAAQSGSLEVDLDTALTANPGAP